MSSIKTVSVESERHFEFSARPRTCNLSGLLLLRNNDQCLNQRCSPTESDYLQNCSNLQCSSDRHQTITHFTTAWYVSLATSAAGSDVAKVLKLLKYIIKVQLDVFSQMFPQYAKMGADHSQSMFFALCPLPLFARFVFQLLPKLCRVNS